MSPTSSQGWITHGFVGHGKILSEWEGKTGGLEGSDMVYVLLE